MSSTRACAKIALIFRVGGRTMPAPNFLVAHGPGHLVAKLHMETEYPRQMSEIFHDLDHQFGRQEDDERANDEEECESSSALFDYTPITPEMLDQTSRLNDFSRIFDGGHVNCFADVKFSSVLPLVCIELDQDLKGGRLVCVSGGRRFKVGTEEAEWVPIWTRTVEQGAKIVKTPAMPPELVKQSTAKFMLRFEFQFDAAKLDPFCTIMVSDERVSLGVGKTKRPIIPPATSCLPNGSNTAPKFPVEIWFKVLSHIDCKLSTLAALSGTCREWRNLFGQPVFYETLDFKPLATKLNQAPTEFFEFLLNRCSKSKHLRLSWIPCSSLKGFKLSDFIQRIEPSSLVTFVSEECKTIDDSFIYKLVEKQPSIQVLRITGPNSMSEKGYKPIANLKNLRAISLCNMPSIPAESLHPLFAGNCKHLETFECVNIPSESIWYDLSLHFPQYLTEMAPLAKNLKTIHIDLMNTIFSDFPLENKKEFLQSFLGALPQLEELYFYENPRVFLMGEHLVSAVRLSKVCPNLKRMSQLIFCPAEAGIRFKKGLFAKVCECFGGLQHLERLTFMSLDDFQANWPDLLKSLPMMRELVVFRDFPDNSDNPATITKRFPNCSFVVRPAVQDNYSTYDMGFELRNYYEESDEEDGEHGSKKARHL